MGILALVDEKISVEYSMKYRNFIGFSLIELMIALVIVAILISVAYPSYLNHIQRTRRADAISSLLSIQAQVERCYINDFSYSDCADDTGLPQNSTGGHYVIDVDADQTTNSAYVLTATSQDQQADDHACSVFTVDNIGSQTAIDDSNDDSSTVCW